MKKRIVGTIGLGLITVAAMPIMAHAQSTTKNLEDVLPENVDMLYQYNTAEKNPLEDLAKSWIESQIKSTPISKDQTDNDSLKNIIITNLSNNNFELGMTMPVTAKSSASQEVKYEEPTIYYSFNLSADDLNKAIAISEKQNGKAMTKETYGNQTIYAPTESLYFTQLNNLVVVTNSKDAIKTLVDNNNNASSKTLAKSESFTKSAAKNIANDFFSMFINIQSFYGKTANEEVNTALLTNTLFNQSALQTIKAENISFAQADNGFNFQMFVLGDKEKLAQTGIKFDEYNFVPAIYKLVSGKDIIYYAENNNLKASYDTVFKMLNLTKENQTDFDNFKKQFTTDSGLDIDQDILPLFTNRSAIAIHKTSSILPSFTFILENKDQSKTQTIIDKLATYIKKNLDKTVNPEKTTYTYETTTINGDTFHKFNFKVSGTGMTQLDGQTISVVMGLTKDGYVVVSTNSDFTQIFGQNNGGIVNNSSIDKLFQNREETISEMTYLSVDQLLNYSQQVATTFNAPAELKTIINTVIAPWHNTFTKSYADSESATATGTIEADIIKLADYAKLGEQFEALSEKMSFRGDFNDVNKSDWYFNSVDKLNRKGIINGYENNGTRNFMPAKEITRAEFVKMAMSVYEKINNTSVYMDFENESSFTDVDNSEDWFGVYVNSASKKGFVKGFSDKTFRPNALITRAEAAQILYNMSSKIQANYSESANVPFSDILKTDWCFKAVSANYSSQIITGTSATTFAPNKNLNRAEAANLFSKFLTEETGK